MGKDRLFDDDYMIQSAANNAINLEVPLAPLNRALKSAATAVSVSIRLTKKDNFPLLSLTIVVQSAAPSAAPPPEPADDVLNPAPAASHHTAAGAAPREITVTQDVSIRVLSPAAIEELREPSPPSPEVYVIMPALAQVKAVSERFTRLGAASSRSGQTAALVGAGSGPRLKIAANMHGEMRLGIRTDALEIESAWVGLNNPELETSENDGNGTQNPSSRMKEVFGPESWASVHVGGRDWIRVLGVGRLGGRVIAAICKEQALVLYVYLPNDDESEEDSVITYHVTSYSA